MKRVSRVAGVGVLVVAGVAVYALAQSGGASPLNPIAQAAVRTENAPGARYLFRSTVDGPWLRHPISMTGAGLYNGKTNRSRINLSIKTPGGRARLEGIGSGTQLYYRSELFKNLPSGDEWVGLDASLGASSEGAYPVNSDPAAALGQLRAVSDTFEKIGTARIGGVETTGYRGTVDPDGLPAYLREQGADGAAEKYERVAETTPTTSDVETWIDANDLVRRMKMTTHTNDRTSGKESAMTVTADFYDFGISPEIDLPESGKVYDITPLLEEKLGLDGSS